MPIYEFCCKKCKNEFEVLFRSSQEKKDIFCPKCGSEKTEKLVSLFGMTGSNSKSDTFGSASGSSSCGSCSSGNCSSCH